MSFSKFDNSHLICVLDDTPVTSKKGIVVGPEYFNWMKSNTPAGIVPDRVVKSTILRMTLVTSVPLNLECDGLATFLIPPHSPGFNNLHPIRVYQ